MKPHLAFAILSALLFSLLFTGCVSIDIKPPTSSKADDYDYEDPDDPFDDIAAGDADEAWQSEQTGNTIAILSECNSSGEPNLKSLQNETLGAMSKTQILSSEKERFGKHEALRTLAEGQVDGVTVQLLLFSIKRNNCVYSMTYVGRKEAFQKELPIFDKFIKEFELE